MQWLPHNTTLLRLTDFLPSYTPPVREAPPVIMSSERQPMASRQEQTFSEPRAMPATHERELQRHVHEAMRTVSRLPWTESDHDGSADGIHAALQHVCASAREREVPVERLLVLLKGAWRQQAATPGLSHAETEGMLARVITRCIKEYYRPVARS